MTKKQNLDVNQPAEKFTLTIAEISQQEAAQLPADTQVLVYNPILLSFSIIRGGKGTLVADSKNKLYNDFHYYVISATRTVKTEGYQGD